MTTERTMRPALRIYTEGEKRKADGTPDDTPSSKWYWNTTASAVTGSAADKEVFFEVSEDEEQPPKTPTNDGGTEVTDEEDQDDQNRDSNDNKYLTDEEYQDDQDRDSNNDEHLTSKEDD